jgi:hypothetical protein
LVNPDKELASVEAEDSVRRTGVLSGRSIRRTWFATGTIWGSRFLVAIAVGYFAVRALRPPSTFATALDPGTRSVFLSLFHWDSVEYLWVAAHGYTDPAKFAYFPLFPLFIRGVHALTGLDYADASVLITWSATLVLVASLVVLARDCLGLERWQPVVLLAIWSPASFVFFSAYPEPIEMLLLALVLVNVSRRRYLLAAVLSGLASGIAPLGVLFAIAVGIGVLQDPDARRRLARLASLGVISELGVIGYMAYLQVAFHEPIAFVTAQKYWDRRLTYPFHGLVWSVTSVLEGHPLFTAAREGNWVVTDGIDDVVTVLATVALVALVVHVARNRRWRSPMLPGLCFAGVALVFNVSDATAGGVSPEALARHLGVLVPLYLAAGLLRRSEVWALLLAVSVVLGALAQTLFCLGLWFT